MKEHKDNEQRFRVELTLRQGWKLNTATLISYLLQLSGLVKSVDKCEELTNEQPS